MKPFFYRKRAFVFLLALFFSSGSLYSRDAYPLARQGVLDLHNMALDKGVAIPLKGDWAFYWKRFVDPHRFVAMETWPSPDGYIAMPSSWNDFPVQGGKAGSDGFATYHLQVQLPDSASGQLLALRIQEPATAYHMFINGESAASAGIPGETEETTTPVRDNVIYRWKAQGTRLDLVFHVSNFAYRKGGIWLDVKLASSEEMSRRHDLELLFEFFLFGALSIIGFYHIGIYFARKTDYAPLLFGAFSLLIAVRILFTGDYYIRSIFPSIGFDFQLKVEYLTFYLAAPIFTPFISRLFFQGKERYLTQFAIITAMPFVLMVLFTPPSFYTRYLTPYQVIVVIASLWGIFAMGMAVYRKEKGALISFLGILVFVATVINDMMNNLELLYTGFLVPMGLFVFLLTQAYMLAQIFAHDYFKVKELGIELEQKNADLKRMDTIKDEFLANTSHELRTPLHGIIGLAESSILFPDSRENNLKNSEMIIASARRLASLVNDILDFSKLKNRDIDLRIRPLKFPKISELVAGMFVTTAREKKIELYLDVPSDLPLIRADEDRLQQILINLVGNAIKFTEKGCVTLSAEYIPESDRVNISVSDTGIGIPQDMQEKIFESFEQASGSIEREYGGTGLGLAIVKSLLQLHGSEIEVISEVGKGSIFRFALDVAKPDEAGTEDGGGHIRVSSLTEEPVKADAGVRRSNVPTALDIHTPDDPLRPTILAVDDDDVNLLILENFLQAEGYNVWKASEGNAALKMLGNGTPDLILLDVMMPRMNGYAVAHKIREQYNSAELPIIMLTARNQLDDLVKGLEVGASDYLPKPFYRSELIARIQTQLNLVSAYREAKELRAELLENEKMAVVGQYASRIVHDMKNLAGIVMGYATIALEDSLTRENRDKFLSRIARESGRLADMAQDILRFARNERDLELKWTDAVRYSNDLADTISLLFTNRDIQFQCDCTVTGRLLMDASQITRAIMNVAINASEVLHAGDSFTFRVYGEENRMIFHMKDSGPGIPEKIRDTLFFPFVTEGKSFGTGLGLAITRSIVEAHKGRIWFEPEAEGGTSFFIELPNLESERLDVAAESLAAMFL